MAFYSVYHIGCGADRMDHDGLVVALRNFELCREKPELSLFVGLLFSIIEPAFPDRNAITSIQPGVEPYKVIIAVFVGEIRVESIAGEKLRAALAQARYALPVFAFDARYDNLSDALGVCTRYNLGPVVIERGEIKMTMGIYQAVHQAILHETKCLRFRRNHKPSSILDARR
jgi:hypothetical protein